MDRLRSSKLLYHNALSGLKIDFVDNVRSLWGGLLHKVVDESHSITGIYSCIIFCLQNFVSICWVSTILSSKPRYLKNNVNGTLEWRTGLYKHPQHRLPSYSIKSLSILHHLLFHSLSYLSYTTLSSLSFAIFPVLHFLIFPFLHCSILSFSSQSILRYCPKSFWELLSSSSSWRIWWSTFSQKYERWGNINNAVYLSAIIGSLYFSPSTSTSVTHYLLSASCIQSLAHLFSHLLICLFSLKQLFSHSLTNLVVLQFITSIILLLLFTHLFFSPPLLSLTYSPHIFSHSLFHFSSPSSLSPHLSPSSSLRIYVTGWRPFRDWEGRGMHMGRTSRRRIPSWSETRYVLTFISLLH